MSVSTPESATTNVVTSKPATSGPATRRRSPFATFFGRLIKEKPLGAVSAAVVVILVLMSVFAGALAPYDIEDFRAKDRLQGPSAAHPLGTDHLGRDLLTRIIFGGRLSLFVGLSATAINTLVALLVGGISGYVGGKVDVVVQRFVDAWMAFPGLLLLLTIMSIVGRGVPQVILVLGVTGGIAGSRVVRGAVIGVRENTYFQAAQTVGSPLGRTIVRHVIPNIAPVLIVIFSINIPKGIHRPRLRLVSEWL